MPNDEWGKRQSCIGKFRQRFSCKFSMRHRHTFYLSFSRPQLCYLKCAILKVRKEYIDIRTVLRKSLWFSIRNEAWRFLNPEDTLEKGKSVDSIFHNIRSLRIIRREILKRNLPNGNREFYIRPRVSIKDGKYFSSFVKLKKSYLRNKYLGDRSEDKSGIKDRLKFYLTVEREEGSINIRNGSLWEKICLNAYLFCVKKKKVRFVMRL